MSENPTPPATRPHPPAEEMHWGISYLREDIQDLRQEMRENVQGLRSEIQGVRQEVQEVRQELRGEVRSIHTRIDETSRYLADRLDSRFMWLLATMVALTGVIVAVIKI